MKSQHVRSGERFINKDYENTHHLSSLIDNRPHLFGVMEGVNVNFLLDSGATISVISNDLFKLIKKTEKFII